MRINKPVGSKERLVEIFQKVNKVKLNENLLEMGGVGLNPENVLNMAFNQLKNKRLNVEHSNTQANGAESFVELMCVDNQGNNITFTFKTTSSEGDQDGVFNVGSVILSTFSFDSADGEESVELAEDGLKRFNQQHANEMFDVIQDYLDVEPQGAESAETSNELAEAIKLIDAIKKDSSPYGGGFDKMQTGKNYGDKKPTNDAVRVKSPELDKFVQEGSLEEFDKPAMKLIQQGPGGSTAGGVKQLDEMNKPIAGMTLGGVIENDDENAFDDDDQEVTLDNLEGEPEGDENQPEVPEEVPGIDDELPVDTEPAPEVSQEKKEKIYQAYDNIVKRQRNPNYSPTTAEIMAELDKMAGVVKPRNTRTVSKEAIPYLAEEEEKNAYPDPMGKKFKPKSRYPKKKKKPQSVVKISEDVYGDEDISNLPDAPSGWGGKLQATKDMMTAFTKKGNTDPRGDVPSDKWAKYPLPYDTKMEFAEDEEKSQMPGVDTDDEGMPIPAIEPDFDKMGMGIGSDWDKQTRRTNGDGMSLEPQGDEIEQIANDKEEVGELIPGGKGDGKSPLEFTPDQILKGMKVEMEHTDDPMFALEITMDHLTEDPEYYGSDEEDPDKMAQTNASADVEGGEGDDKEMTDMLLGFKPHNVGDEIEGEEEIEEPEEQTPEHEAGETPEEEKIETEEEPEEVKKELNEGQIKIARETLSYRRVPTGMTKKEAVQILIKHNIR